MKLELAARFRCEIKRESDPQGGYRYRANCPFLSLEAKGDKKEDAQKNLALSVESALTSQVDYTMFDTDDQSRQLVFLDRITLTSGKSSIDIDSVQKDDVEAEDVLESGEYWLEQKVQFIPDTAAS